MEGIVILTRGGFFKKNNEGMREPLTISTYFIFTTMCLRLRFAYNGPKFVLGAYLKLFILGYDEIIILIPKYGQIF